MWKIFIIISILFSPFLFNSAYAEVNQPGKGGFPDEKCKESTLKNYKKNFEQAKSEGKNFVMYASINETGCTSHNTYTKVGKEISNKNHKYAYKKCKKKAKKFTEGDCFIFAINDKIVWESYEEILVVKKKNDSDDLESMPFFLEEDKKAGRYFKDQPDISNDFQVHVVYTLYKDSKDKEGDINGKVEELMRIADDWIYKTTKKSNKESNTFNGEGQRLKWDRREDGKLDISFLRLNVTKKRFNGCKWSCGNIFGKSIVHGGFNDPKKIYVNFGDFAYKDWAYAAGYPIFNIFSKMAGNPLRKSEVGYFILHEILHSMGGINYCSPNYMNGHNTKRTSDLMSSNGDGTNHTLDPNNDDYWGHDNKTCPDLQDSVFFTPTSDTPFSPFEVTCLPKEKWKITKHDYDKNNLFEPGDSDCFYGRTDIDVPWKKELGVIERN